ncbi:MAG: hypothetical protein M3N31_00525 [Actinomycetota bacterium]|nr:hypothetical protein [Actinomycetota bacterium]
MRSDLEVFVDTLVGRLSDPANAESAGGFPRDAAAADHPGMYSWWTDDDGLNALSAPFGVRLPPLIYAGQAGATSTRAKTERAATLRSRIGSNHLNGNIGSSTFRKTLTAVLLEPLDLHLARPDRLDAVSNQQLSAWMRQHLRLVIAAHPDRATLARVENAVLRRLDPPLNLMGMRTSPVRSRLRELRSGLSSAGHNSGMRDSALKPSSRTEDQAPLSRPRRR